ncbi:hypothetical protein WJX79_010578 [Trebouxia sp. C0005]
MRRVTPAWSPSQGRSLAIRRFAAQNANSSAQPSALSPLTAALIAHTLRGVNDASVGLSITVLIWSRSEVELSELTAIFRLCECLTLG